MAKPLNTWNKILWKSKAHPAFYLGLAGLAAGMTIFSLCFGLYIGLGVFNSSGDQTRSYLIISKKVSLTNTLMRGTGGFGQEEFDRLRGLSFIQDAGKFTPAAFSVDMTAGGNLGFATELFLESVPDRFLDLNPPGWRWRPGQKRVPMILSRDFLQIFNFAYAPGRGLPPVTEGMASMVPLKLRLKGAKGILEVEASIAGFTDRLNGVFVPEPFMEWANRELGSPAKGKASKLIVQYDPAQNHAIGRYLSEMDYQSGATNLLRDKTHSWLLAANTALILLGIIILLLGFSSFISGVRIVMLECSGAIALLHTLGNSKAAIRGFYFKKSGGHFFYICLLPSLLLYSVIILSLKMGVPTFSAIVTPLSFAAGIICLVVLSLAALLTNRYLLRSGTGFDR